MKLIALEEHFLTPAVREAWSRLDPAYQDRTQALLGAPELAARLDDFAELRIQQMDESGVDVQGASKTFTCTSNEDCARCIGFMSYCL